MNKTLKKIINSRALRPLKVIKRLGSIDDIKKTYEKYHPSDCKLSIFRIYDICHTGAWLGFSFDEYFSYRMYSLCTKERKKYIPDNRHTDITNALNQSDNFDLFQDKDKTYEIFKSYYGRELIRINPECSSAFSEYDRFINHYKRIIVKPVDLYCGFGVRIVEQSNDNMSDYLEMAKEYPHGFIAEELIVQCDELKSMHSESVNTVRITTLKMNDRTMIIHPFIRFGVGETVVDNGGSGGLLCPINIETGEVYASADELGRMYTVHPNSGKRIIGFIVPKWEEAKKLALELSEVVPNNRWIGWDLALTPTGWVMVEGNCQGQFVGWQIPNQEGFRDELKLYLDELGIDLDKMLR